MFKFYIAIIFFLCAAAVGQDDVTEYPHPFDPLPCTNQNEIWRTCYGCDLTCEIPYQHCRGCSNGCFCKDGYARDINNECIKIKLCPKCDNPYEEYKFCGSACPPTCASRERRCPDVCVEGCFCKSGYIREKIGGKCILIANCHNLPTCKNNEVLIMCPKYCTFNDDCGMAIQGFVRECNPPPPGWTCKPTCFCKPGFVSINGQCVSAQQCCLDPNEETTDCPAPCDETCIAKPPAGCKLTPCAKKGCRCKKDYVRDANNRCILKKDCPQLPVCGNDEVLNICPKYCTFEDVCTWVIFGIVKDCMTPPPNWVCKPRCDCKNGLVRISGKCEPVKKCCLDPNEEITSCPAPCDETCTGKPAPGCQLKPCNKKGCHCKKGYVRDANNLCILKKDCPQLPVCGNNEVLIICPDYCTFNDDCAMVIEGFVRECNPAPPGWTCKPTCFCKPGFVSINGPCVSAQQCCLDPNEIITDCPVPCDETCTGKPKDECQLRPCAKKGCRCKNNYVRDDNNRCILKTNCPPLPVCAYDEDLNICPKYCTYEDECSWVIAGQKKECSTPAPNWVCKPRCECKKGLVRMFGKCEPVAKCCNTNEVLTSCPAGCNTECFQPTPPPTCQLKPCNQYGCKCQTGHWMSTITGLCTMTCP